MLHKLPSVTHLVVWDPNALEILDEEHIESRQAQVEAGDVGEDVVYQVAKRPVRDEKEAATETVQITLVDSIGPEDWDLHVLEGKGPHGYGRAGRIVIGDADVPSAALAWTEEANEPRVHNIYVEPDMRRKGVARLLYDAYRRHVSPNVVTVGPFSEPGLETAKALSDEVREACTRVASDDDEFEQEGAMEVSADSLHTLKELDRGRMETELDDYARWSDSYSDDNRVHMGRLMQRDHDGRKEWALVSKSAPSKVLKWFGPSKPSAEAVEKEERRVQYFKHQGSIRVARPEGAPPWVAVDLDGTILDYTPGMGARGEFGEPLDGAVESLRELKSLGWRVSIYTARTTGLDDDLRSALVTRISDLLSSHGIPFDDIWTGPKPHADVFIDDRAVKFTDWESALLDVVGQGRDGRPETENGTVVEGVVRDTMDDENDFLEVGGPRRDLAIERPPAKEEMLYG